MKQQLGSRTPPEKDDLLVVNSVVLPLSHMPGTGLPVPGMVLLLVVLVVEAPPEACLVATAWCAVEPLVHAPKAVQPTCVGRIGMVDDAVLKRDRAHARGLSRVRCQVRAGTRRELRQGF